MSGAVKSRVAVVMPAYNAERFIERAVKSLQASTYPCDLYVVDDASDRPVSDLLNGYPRTTILRREVNGGPGPARNAALEVILARGYEFVAILDADDICYPDRIGRQVEFLDSHPHVGVVGTWSRAFDEATGKILRVGRQPADPADVRREMRYNSAIANSSSMMRVRALREYGFYSPAYPAAEDYELFRRIGQQYEIANIPEVLMDISISPEGVTLSRRRRQLFDRLAIQLKYFEPAEPGAWLGILKTLVLFAVPVSLISWIKSSLSRVADDLSAEPVEEDKVEILPPPPAKKVIEKP